MARKVCKHCRLFVEKDTCPVCKDNQFLDAWKGRLFVLDFSKSEIAKKLEIKANGEYAIKTR